MLLTFVLPYAFKSILKDFASHTPLKKYFFERFSYLFTVPQLIFLCQCLEEVKDIKGDVAEVGCYTGKTTLFLNQYLSDRKIEKKYYALDTFSGFISEDVKFEVENRAKTASLYKIFYNSKKKWFDQTMAYNNFNNVVSIKADVNEFDLTTLGNLSFVLLDVDLYRPVKKALKELYKILSPNGIIVIDDCDSKNFRWDGAYQAYKEFMEEINQPINIVHNKLGIIKKHWQSTIEVTGKYDC